MNRNEVLPTIMDALEGNNSLITKLGGTGRIFFNTASLPAIFPGLGVNYKEVGSKRRAGYNTYKVRDCTGEVDIIVQVATTMEDAIAIEKIVDEILLGGITGTRGWHSLYNNNNSMNDEKLMGVQHLTQDIYRFEYTVTDP